MVRKWAGGYPVTDLPAGASYHLESLTYSAATGGWVGVWLDTPLGFHRHPAVSLHARTRDQVLALAADRGLPWPDPAEGADRADRADR